MDYSIQPFKKTQKRQNVELTRKEVKTEVKNGLFTAPTLCKMSNKNSTQSDHATLQKRCGVLNGITCEWKFNMPITRNRIEHGRM